MKTQLPKFFVAALAVCFVSGVFAQTVPALVNYQGRLANPDGTALATGDYQLTFRVYDSATNSTGLVWGPQVFDGVAGQGHGGKIPVVQGYFNVMLGPVDTNGASLANAFNGTNRFVEVTVSNRPPILPRQQILAAPFAFQAANSATLAGYDWSVVFGTNDPAGGQIQTSRIADGAVTFPKLASRQPSVNAGVGGMARSQIVTFLTNSSSFVEVPNLTVTLATSGRPVMVALVPGTNVVSGHSIVMVRGNDSAGILAGNFSVWRNGSQISDTRLFLDNNNSSSSPVMQMPPNTISTVDFPPAGANSYTIRVKVTQGNEVNISQSMLCAFEL